MSSAIHVFRLRCLSARIRADLYSDAITSRPDQSAYNTRAKQFHTELDNWIASVPPIPHRTGTALSVFPSSDWYELSYSESIILLHRGRLTGSEDAQDSVFMECVRAAENICNGCRRQYIGKPVNYTWGTLHTLFMAGLTYLHCVWASPTVRQTVRYDDMSSTFTTCTMLLAIMADRWEGAGPYRDLFEALASRALTMVVDETRKEQMAPAPTPSEGLDEGDLARWISEVTDMGMSDGLEGILSGLIVQGDPGTHWRRIGEGLHDLMGM
ncbi:Positive regulator of purine utilization [Tolypocladium ophioglossoides CBS 100239]|uniref:Positive regulator of purine utilization n=1 Tax=Tolypocladium ophioglossoides (strain CBS 100239) TaxID=1163406 RepID=A0A0L0NCV7_TOLOC|nr:Positive regulator of purine utilization [Tolypocladium ophioglossoides CBS 100239]